MLVSGGSHACLGFEMLCVRHTDRALNPGPQALNHFPHYFAVNSADVAPVCIASAPAQKCEDVARVPQLLHVLQ